MESYAYANQPAKMQPRYNNVELNYDHQFLVATSLVDVLLYLKRQTYVIKLIQLRMS